MIKDLAKDVSGLAMSAFSRVAIALADDPTGSLPEFTNHTRLSPVTLIGKDITLLPEDQVQNLLQTASAIFASHYLQAVAVGMSINGVQTVDLLAPFSTSSDSNVTRSIRRTMADRMRTANDSQPAQESFKLPMFDGEPTLEEKAPDLSAHANLAVGRLLHVSVGEPGKTVTVPVTLTINPKVVSTDALPKLVTVANRDDGFWARLHQFRAGEIESVQDYLFALDLIEADRKAMLNDETGLYKEIQERKRSGFFKRLLTGRSNINNASAIHIVSKGSMEDIEMALRGKMSRFRTRQEYFKMTNAMLVIEVDARMERFNLYQRGIDDVGTFTFRDIENHGKNANAMDMSALMKAYKLGESPNTL